MKTFIIIFILIIPLNLISSKFQAYEVKAFSGGVIYFDINKADGSSIALDNNSVYILEKSSSKWQINKDVIPTGHDISQIKMDSKGRIYLLTAESTLYWTDDYGEKWDSSEIYNKFNLYPRNMIIDNSDNLLIFSYYPDSGYSILKFDKSFSSEILLPNGNLILDNPVIDNTGRIYATGRYSTEPGYFVFMSGDGGNSWAKLWENDPYNHILKLIIKSENEIYALCSFQGNLLKSGDNGLSFQPFAVSGVFFNSINLFGKKNEFLLADNYLFDSSGNVVTKIVFPVQSNAYEMIYGDEIFFVNPASSIFRTIDTGNNWTHIGIPTSLDISALAEDNKGALYLGTEKSTVYYATNSDYNFELKDIPIDNDNSGITNIFFSDKDELFVSNSNICVKSSSDMSSWDTIAINKIFKNILQVDDGKFWAFSDNLYYSLDGISWQKTNISTDKFSELCKQPKTKTLYVTTNGLKYSSNSGVEWSSTSALPSELLKSWSGIGYDQKSGSYYDIWGTGYFQTRITNNNVFVMNTFVRVKNYTDLLQQSIYISTDSGINWKLIFNCLSRSNDPSPMEINKNGHLFVALDSCVIQSDDNGFSWDTIPDSPMNINLLYCGNTNKLYAIGNDSLYVLDEELSVDDQHYGNTGISISPNPAKDYIDIRVQNVLLPNEMRRIEITDLTGNLIYCGKLSDETRVDLTGFSPGLYFLSSFPNGQNFFKKILIIR